jgi:hypothetical protein
MENNTASRLLPRNTTLEYQIQEFNALCDGHWCTVERWDSCTTQDELRDALKQLADDRGEILRRVILIEHRSVTVPL